MRASIAVMLFATVIASARHPPEAQETPGSARAPTTAAELQRTLDSLRVALRAPGMQAAIRRHGALVWLGVTGTADGHAPLTELHLIRMGSITKTYTAAVVLQLVAEGRLRLDDPLSHWFPEIPNAQRVTIRHLLSHTSGLRELLEKKSFLMRATMFPGHRFRVRDALGYLSDAKPYFAPSAGFHYSNSNYVLLGAIIERVTDSTSAQLIRARLLDPLRLERTAFLPDEAGRMAPPGVAKGFDRDHIPMPGSYKVGERNQAWATLAYTSGAMAANAGDVASWMESLMRGGVLPDSLVALASEMGSASDAQIRELQGYGLGLASFAIDDERWLGHLGDFIGSGGAAVVSGESGYTIAVLGNMSAFDGVAAVRALHRALKSAE